jgi:hypothetical protein
VGTVFYRARWPLLLFGLTIAGGCTDGLARVSGQVTLDGQSAGGPDRYGTVSFYRASGGGAPAIGIIDESGRYALKTGSRNGVEPGTYLVGISVQRVSPPASPGDMPKATLISPKKYASVNESGFRYEVKPGSNSIDFALSTNVK